MQVLLTLIERLEKDIGSKSTVVEADQDVVIGK